jgi:hypothetical protein
MEGPSLDREKEDRDRFRSRLIKIVERVASKLEV